MMPSRLLLLATLAVCTWSAIPASTSPIHTTDVATTDVATSHDAFNLLPISRRLLAPAALTTPATVSFGSSLLQTLRKGNSAAQVFISPLSVSEALALLLNGATPTSSSAAELSAKVFFQSKPKAARGNVNNAYSGLHKALKSPAATANGKVSVTIANSIWAKPPAKFSSAYTQRVQSLLGAASFPLTSAAAVNNWVSKNTNGKIKTIVDDDAVKASTAILVNALYFKAPWYTDVSTYEGKKVVKLTFDAKDTKQARFFSAPNKPSKVQMMTSQQPWLRYAVSSDGKCTAVRIPYAGQQFVGLFAIPTAKKTTLTDCVAFLSKLSTTAAAAAKGKAKSPWKAKTIKQGCEEVPGLLVKLPKFKIEEETDLKASLKQMGVVSPFTKSDFSDTGIAGLSVSRVIHKVYVEVNELGTEAAAVTAITMPTACMPGSEKPREITFDRPFVFSISHEPSGSSLFLGTIVKP